MSVLNVTITCIAFTQLRLLSERRQSSQGGRQTHRQEEFAGNCLSLEGTFLCRGLCVATTFPVPSTSNADSSSYSQTAAPILHPYEIIARSAWSCCLLDGTLTHSPRTVSLLLASSLPLPALALSAPCRGFPGRRRRRKVKSQL